MEAFVQETVPIQKNVGLEPTEHLEEKKKNVYWMSVMNESFLPTAELSFSRAQVDPVVSPAEN